MGRVGGRLGARALLGTLGFLVALVAPAIGPVGAAPGAPSPAAAPVPAGGWGVGAPGAAPCDGLDPSGCLLPFPNDYDTVPDRATATGRRVSFPAGAFPDAAGRAPLDPSPWSANDGFSPGASILVHVEGISLARSGAATLSDIGASESPASPVVLVDAGTGHRWPTWSELDVNDPDPSTRCS